MDAAYESQCAQVGVPPHPALLCDFAAYDARRAAVLQLGGPAHASSNKERPIRDVDVMAVCLVVRSLAKVATVAPLVRLDFTGELITCEGARTLAAVLQANCVLQAVVLRQTFIADEGAAALGAALGGSALAELDLGECRISNAGVRLFVRGVQMHGTPSTLQVLLLDGNPISDAGVVDMISFVEGPHRPPGLSTLSVHPAPPSVLSDEVNAALHVVCDLCHVELRRGRRAAGRALGNLQAEEPSAGSFVGLPPAPSPAPAAQAATPATACAGLSRQGSSQSLAPMPPQWWTAATPVRAASPARALSPAGVADVRAGRSSGHLAAWMAGTERELRELKWLLGASAARLDGQHTQLMSEVEKLRGQLDMWARSGAAGSETPAGGEGRLEVLEARFDALEQLVGREQSECAQMWQLVEVAAGAGAASSQVLVSDEPGRESDRRGEQ